MVVHERLSLARGAICLCVAWPPPDENKEKRNGVLDAISEPHYYLRLLHGRAKGRVSRPRARAYARADELRRRGLAHVMNATLRKRESPSIGWILSRSIILET